MKRLSHFLMIFVVALFLAGCGSGNKIKGNGKIVSQDRSINSFNELAIDGSFIVTVNTNQSANTLQVKADENLLPYIVNQTNNNVLSLGVKPGYRLNPSVPVQILINTQSIQRVDIKGPATFIAGTLSGDQLMVNMSGSGTSVLKGNLKTATLDITGSAQVNANELVTENMNVKILGSAQASVNVTNKLNVYIKGSGQVTFFGNPPIVDQEIYEGGKLIKGQ